MSNCSGQRCISRPSRLRAFSVRMRATSVHTSGCQDAGGSSMKVDGSQPERSTCSASATSRSKSYTFSSEYFEELVDRVLREAVQVLGLQQPVAARAREAVRVVLPARPRVFLPCPSPPAGRRSRSSDRSAASGRASRTRAARRPCASRPCIAPSSRGGRSGCSRARRRSAIVLRARKAKPWRSK
jgi:hypothetical protein